MISFCLKYGLWGGKVKTLILYGTRYGSTQRYVHILAEKIAGEVTVENLGKNKNPDIKPYDVIIIGGPIMAGKMHSAVSRFVNVNLQKLLSKKTALFICCLHQGEKARQQLVDAFSPKLVEEAAGYQYFGGEVDFRKLNFFLKGLMRKVMKTEKNVSHISTENIEQLAQAVNHVSSEQDGKK